MQVEAPNEVGNTDVESDIFPIEDFDEGYEPHDKVHAPKLWFSAPGWREVPADRTYLRSVTVSNIGGGNVNEMTQVCGKAGNNQRRKVTVTAYNNIVALSTSKEVPVPVEVTGSGSTAVDVVSTAIILDASDASNRVYEHVSCDPLYAICLDATVTNLAVLSVAEESYYESGEAGGT